MAIPLLGFSLLADTTPAGTAAHEEAVLESAASSAPAGGSLPLNGKDFTAEERYELRLLGALREYDLREVEAGADGTFALELMLPADVRPGAYQVVAIAPDGDVVARLDLTVLEAVPASDPAEAAAGGGDGATHRAGGATDEEIRIERSRSGVEWGLIGLIVGGAGGLGIGLLRRGGAAA